MKRERVLWLDAVKVLACLMVVLMHSPMPSDLHNGLFLSIISYSTSPCIGLFFMVSGALLLPVKENSLKFLTRRLGKIVVPTVMWSIVYLVVAILEHEEIAVGRALISIPFSSSIEGVLWFMYTLIGLYLVAPIISPWLERLTEREATFYLALAALTFCLPYVALVSDVNTSQTGIFYYLSGYVVYFYLGWYMIRFPHRLSLRWLVPMALVALALPVLVKLAGWVVDFYSLFWYLSLPVMVLCAFIFRLFSMIQNTCLLNVVCVGARNLLIEVSNLSFGIYLIHILVMRHVLWCMSIIQNISNPIMQTLVVFTFTIVVSIITCMLVSRMPWAQYIIGYRKR